MTDGGGATGAVPTAADDALFTANSGNCTVNASNRVCKTLNFTGYTNTITMTFGITVSGNVTLVAAMTIAGASGLTINATGTFTSNGKTWPNALTFSATNTLTLADDLSIGGLLTINNATSTTVNGSFNINVNGGILLNGTMAKSTGTPIVNLLGGTWSGGGAFAIDVNINGNITLLSNVYFGNTASTPTLTYTSGTVTVTGSTLNIIANTGQSPTLNTGGMTWNNVSYGASNAGLTLLSNLNIGGTFTTTTLLLTINGTFSINCSGGLDANLAQGTGTTTLNLLGGTWSGGKTVRLNTNINGNITISGTVGYQTGTLTYTSGEVTTTGSTLNIVASCTLNTSGMSWNNVTTNSGATITLTSDLNINGLLNVAGNTLTNGSFNINVNSLFIISASVIGVNTGNPTLNFMGNGSWSGSGRLIMNTNIYGNTIINGTVSFDSRILTNYSTNVKTINNPTLQISFATPAILINIDKINFKTIIITAGATITMNRFFSGSASRPTTVRSGTTGSTYTIVFQDGFEKITKFTKISNCTVSRPGQLLCITDKSNKGGNVGIRYINQSPNGIAKNAPTSPNPMAYGLPSFLDSDPNFITG